jgi:hypothetical protein
MSEQDVETIKGAYEAFGQGNIPGVLAVLDPEAEWTEPGGGKSPSGTFKGPDEVGSEVFPPVQENFDEFVCTPENYDDQGDTVVVTGKFTGKNKSGAELDSSFEHTWKLRDGKVVSMENKVDEGWAAGWS